MTDDERALEDIKAQLATQRGLIVCHSVGCFNVAQVRVHWPVATGKEYPLYCSACAQLACWVLDALGIAPKFDILPKKEQPIDLRERGIEL